VRATTRGTALAAVMLALAACGGGFVDISGQIGAPAVQNSRTHDPVLIKDPRHFVVVACRQRADSTAPETNLPDMATALLKLIAPRVK
jgi:hypothetical protein